MLSGLSPMTVSFPTQVCALAVLFFWPSITANDIRSAEGDLPQTLTERRAALQKLLERSFGFNERDSGILFSLSQYSGDPQIHIIYDPKKRWLMSFKFVGDGKEVLTLDGHNGSTFRTADDILYFAHFWPWAPGCRIAAYHLRNGKELWETELSGVGQPGHSAYLNQVTLEVRHIEGVDREGEASVLITGSESYGQYREVLDAKTGLQLAHKVYRKGFGEPRKGNPLFDRLKELEKKQRPVQPR